MLENENLHGMRSVKTDRARVVDQQIRYLCTVTDIAIPTAREYRMIITMIVFSAECKDADSLKIRTSGRTTEY